MAVIDTIGIIKAAIDGSPRNSYSAELHLQMIKYADELQGMTGKEFCEALGISTTYGTEFSKMRKIAGRLKAAGLDVSRI
ncbi:transcription factor [Novosphingobium sp.]|uniref:HTH-like domain-containing protein n=1 Tax=Novosphingobium sp. TaxID=1874826 RepID=UPI0033416844